MTHIRIQKERQIKLNTAIIASLCVGLLSGLAVAKIAAPTEHVGLTVNKLGEIKSLSLNKQLGLAGHKLQLREITIAPGGQIAKHSHANRPGLVKVLNGVWTEGRETGDTNFDDKSAALLEDNETVHWFFNKGEQAATALVCDIVPDES